MPDMPFVGYRKILHVDMDAFYASVEVKDRPELKGKPVIVGGTGSRAVVAAASYEARQSGVHSAMSIARAKRLCPQGIYLPPRFERYKEISAQLRAIFDRYTDLIEPLALDEAWLDVTANKQNIPSATWVATHIKWDIENQLGLTSSAGVSYNKFLAKIASGIDKPNGLYIITPKDAPGFLEAIQLSRLPGVGRVMSAKLKEKGLEYGYQLLEWNREDLRAQFGKFGSQLFDLIRGVDDRPVNNHRERKSVGIERTFGVDVGFGPALDRALDGLLRGLFERVKKQGAKGRTLTLKAKFADFKQVTRSASQSKPLSQAKMRQLAQEKLAQLAAQYPKDHLRLLGLSLSGFEGEPKTSPNEQLYLLDQFRETSNSEAD
ncbi:MAG: DNA polymerase IV [bacterium]|nr:DNA polymerase IV [bacterium]